MNAWVLVLILNTKTVDIMEYKYGRDCENAQKASLKILKTIDSGTKINVMCEYREK